MLGEDHTASIPPNLTESAFRRGYGTYEVALDRIGDERYTATIETALELGYSHFDTAQAYDTEPHVAEAIQRSDIERESCFVATKLHWQNLGYEDVIETARASRDMLGVDRIDLLYIHIPADTYDPEETLPAMDTLVDDGVIARIGLSNFTPELLEDAIERLDHPVFAHQVEMHPMLHQEALHRRAFEDGHWIVAFSPYMKGIIAEIREIREIADRFETTPHAVSLAWLLAHPNVATLSHSTSEDHMRANVRGDLPGLDRAAMERIRGIDREHRMWDGRLDPWNQPRPAHVE